jgi:hypothetical protein
MGGLKRDEQLKERAFEDSERPMLPSIRVKPHKQVKNWEHGSRLNYAKIYTVEHNAKVYDFGDVNDETERQLNIVTTPDDTDVNEDTDVILIHQCLDEQGTPIANLLLVGVHGEQSSSGVVNESELLASEAAHDGEMASVELAHLSKESTRKTIARRMKICTGTVLCILAASIGSGWDKKTSRFSSPGAGGRPVLAEMPSMATHQSPFLLLAIGTEVYSDSLRSSSFTNSKTSIGEETND